MVIYLLSCDHILTNHVASFLLCEIMILTIETTDNNFPFGLSHLESLVFLLLFWGNYVKRIETILSIMRYIRSSIIIIINMPVN